MIGDPQDGFSRAPISEDEAQEVRLWLYRLNEHWWIVPIAADMATSARRLGVVFAVLAGLGAGVAWAIRQGWFQ
jgi:hypothetical protein